MGGAAVELVLQFFAQLARPPPVPPGRRAAARRRGRSSAPCPSRRSSRSEIVCGEVELEQRVDRRVEDDRGAGVDRVFALLGDVVGEDRGQRQQADDDAGVAGGDRPAAVDRLRGAAGERGLGQGREDQREADADRICGGTVSDHLGLRQQAPGRRGRRRGGSRRPRRPRPGARHRAGRCGAPSSAASGITVTTIAAPIGLRRQPSISSRTSRKSAAAIAAETIASATLAARCGRPARAHLASRSPRSPSRAWRRRGSAPPATSAIGTWIRKIDCQETSSVRRPPTAGPSAAPVAPARRPDGGRAALGADRRPAAAPAPRSPPAAPPSACTQRAMIRVESWSETPQARPAPAKIARPTAAGRPGPTRRATCAAGTAARAITRLKEIRTQVTPATLVSRSR